MSQKEQTPDKWLVKKVTDVSEVENGGTPDTDTDEYWNGDIPWYTSTELTSNSHPTNVEVDRYITEKGVTESAAKIFQKGNILLTSRGTVGQTKILSEDSSVNQSCYSLSPEEDVSSYFLHYVLQGRRRKLESIAVGGTFGSITKRELRAFDIPIPEIEEQRRIASVLYTVDEHIEQLHDRHDTLTTLKHGLMQDLFTGERRFGEGEHPNRKWTESSTKSLDENLIIHTPNSWQQARLSNLSESSLYGLNESALSENDDGKVEFIRVTNLKSKTSGLNNEMKYVDEDKVENKNLDKNDILFARSGSVGKTYLVMEESTMSYGGYMIRYRINTERINPRFLLQYTKSPIYWDWINRVARGGVQQNISTKEYDDLLIPLPPREEQERIASVLYTVDEMIARTSDLIDEYEHAKRGLMQDLLSGDVRTPEDLEVLEQVAS